MNKFIFVILVIILITRQIIFANTKENTYINTTNITYDEKKNIVELSKNSKINISDTNILVDRGIIDYNKNLIEIFGNFYLYQHMNILSGEDLSGDINLNNFIAYDVSYIYDNDLKIDSDTVEKLEDKIIFQNNFLTTCELDGFFNCPTWSLRVDKTEYDVKRDKFNHFHSFLQIADYKLFYLPYFSHYGSKAQRQKGFLTPSIELNTKGNSGINIPYYLPINESMDIDFKPTFRINDNFEIIDSYHLNTILNQKSSGGITTLTIDNIKNENKNNINSSFRFNTKQIVSKKTVISASAIATNSISTTRSINEEPITYEDIFLKIENYDFLTKSDYLKTEISTVESFDNSNVSQIPLAPSLNYHNKKDFFNKSTLLTDINFRILNRDNSSDNNPKENFILNIDNFYLFNKNMQRYNRFNKISLHNSFNEYKFQHNDNLNRQENKSSLVFSSDNYLTINQNIKPRVKLIYFQNIIKSNNFINEDSNAITFNYQNQFADNRFFGNDLGDNSKRIVYGFENYFNFKKQRFDFNINQSLDLEKNKNYTKKINQSSNYSDYALEAKTNYKNITFKINSRIDQNKLSKKEMNYSLNINKPLELSINYYETDKESYEIVSNDTKSMIINLSKNINENVAVSYNTNLDLKNNYSPYLETITLSFFDECSKLNIGYSNKRFNDNYNTTPEEKISLIFNMDYLGFFGIEQSNNTFGENRYEVIKGINK